MDIESNFNYEKQNGLEEISPPRFEYGYHGGYNHYNHQYRNPFLGYGFIGPFAGGLLGGLAAGALFGGNHGYGSGSYPYYGGYPYPPPYYYGGYGYPYWRYY